MITPKIIKREYKSGFKAEVILKPHFLLSAFFWYYYRLW